MTIDQAVTEIANKAAREAHSMALTTSRADLGEHIRLMHATAPPPPPPPPPPDPVPPVPTPTGIPARFAGMTQYYAYEASAHPSQSGWYAYDGAANQNAETAYFKPGNIAIVPRAADNSCAEFTIKAENWAGKQFTSGMMEHLGATVGNGRPFYAESMIQYDDFDGGWIGWWFLNAVTKTEIDVLEAINFIGPTSNIHFQGQKVGPQSHGIKNDGGWHKYAVGVDGQGVVFYNDNKPVIEHGPYWANAIMGDVLFCKHQLSCGGGWVNDNARAEGRSTPVPKAAGFTPKKYRLDYTRLYR